MINHQTEIQDWQVYLLECEDGSYYCGATNDFINRLKKHMDGRGAKYTRAKKVKSVVCVSCFMTQSEALKLEHLVKETKKDIKPAIIIIYSWMQLCFQTERLRELFKKNLDFQNHFLKSGT